MPLENTFLTLHQIVSDFAVAFKAVDSTAPQGHSKTRTYQPGIGPLTEDEAVRLALGYLALHHEAAYAWASKTLYPGTRQTCDLVIPKEWAIEFKLIRPFGDNGVEAEHWSENILHPYPGVTSAIGDCIKLKNSRFDMRKAVIVFGYEHTPPKIDITVAIRAFEVIVDRVIGIRLSGRYSAVFTELLHPYHQQGKVFGWEIL